MKSYFEKGVITRIKSVPASSGLKVGSPILVENTSPEVVKKDSNGITLQHTALYIHGRKIRNTSRYRLMYEVTEAWFGSRNRKPATLCTPVVAY